MGKELPDKVEVYVVVGKDNLSNLVRHTPEDNEGISSSAWIFARGEPNVFVDREGYTGYKKEVEYRLKEKDLRVFTDKEHRVIVHLAYERVRNS